MMPESTVADFASLQDLTRSSHSSRLTGKRFKIVYSSLKPSRYGLNGVFTPANRLNLKDVLIKTSFTTLIRGVGSELVLFHTQSFSAKISSYDPLRLNLAEQPSKDSELKIRNFRIRRLVSCMTRLDDKIW